MTNTNMNYEDQLSRKYAQLYAPKVKKFFDSLKVENISLDDMDCVPGLFLPCYGELYFQSPLKIAFVGKETLFWCGSLKENYLSR